MIFSLHNPVSVMYNLWVSVVGRYCCHSVSYCVLHMFNLCNFTFSAGLSYKMWNICRLLVSLKPQLITCPPEKSVSYAMVYVLHQSQ